MKNFTATVKDRFNFRENMIQYWIKNENSTRKDVLKAYADEQFEELCDKIETGLPNDFKYDLGYKDKSLDYTLCFEVYDNNTPIPVELLELQ